MIRKQLAGQLAEAVEQLILALVGFPKVLVAAVNGTITGLGETIFSNTLFSLLYRVSSSVVLYTTIDIEK